MSKFSIQLTDSTQYSDSPLAQMLTEALKQIKVIKEKYVPFQKLQKKTEALHLVGLMERDLTKLHGEILPQFSGQRKNVHLSTLKSLYQIGELNKQLFKRISCKEGYYYEFNTNHPMTYEVACSLIQIFTQAPKQLETLAPFFNPKALI